MEPGHPNLELDFLATVFEVARIGICVTDEAGLFVRVNPAFCEMVRYRTEELVGKDYSMCAPVSVANVRDRFLDALLSDSARIPREWMIRRSDGSQFDALVSFRPITRADGRRFVVVTFSDITDAKRAQDEIAALNRDLEQRIAQRTGELSANLSALKAAEEALRESEERTRLILETARDAIVSMNEHGRIGAWNRQAEEMFGRGREAAIGECFWELTLSVEHHRRDAARAALRRYGGG
jgi:PAS domain S-box-containing protein